MARFFAQFGFRLEQREIPANALRHYAGQHEIARSRESGYGRRYEIDGPPDPTDGSRPRVRSVWQVDDRQLAHDSSPPTRSSHDHQGTRLRCSYS